ncbi:MAG: hypothetical protein V1793_24585 [Pseudomonadota bacterium]
MQQENTPKSNRKNKTRSRFLVGTHSGLWLVVVFVLMCELFVYTAARVDCTRKEFEIARVKSARSRAIAYQKELTIEHDRLCSPDRISNIAENRLGLVRPQTDRVIYLDLPGRAAANPVAPVLQETGREN